MADIGHNGGPTLIRGNDGWIAISRAIRTHWLVGFGQPVTPMDGTRGAHSRSEAFIDLLMECRYESGTVSNGGRKMLLQPGQMVGAISWLASRWNWTPKTVRLWLDKLQEDGMIERSVDPNQGKQAAIITVCNYSEYQLVQDQQGQANGTQGASKGQTKGNSTKDKQGNKGTREQEEKDPQTPTGGSPSLDLESAESPKPISGKAIARIAFAEWQEFAKAHGLSIPRDTTFDQFSAAILSRMREHADEQNQRGLLAVWHLALCFVAKSKWLRGMSGDFKADIGMITRPKNFAKLISGGYLNGAAAIDGRWTMQASEGSAESGRQAASQAIIDANEAIAAAEGWHNPNPEIIRE